MDYPALEKKELPAPPKWTKALGVGVVIMGMAMGTGELVLWPHLIVKHGLSLLWLALVGIGAQYIINQEVARHSVATGESFFTTSGRIIKGSPIFWLFGALALYIWPGWASTLGTILYTLLGVGTANLWAWCSLALVLVLTFSGKIAYDMLEKSLRIIVPAFFLMLVVISYYNLNWELIKEALRGFISFGDIPPGVDLNTLLGAVVFAGAGGMLNLCVSLWYRDKGFGMGSYAGRIANPVTGKPEAVSPTGARFNPIVGEQYKRWRGWMTFVRVDQGVIFALLGIVTLFLLSVNAYAVLKPAGIIPSGAQVAVAQAKIFSEQWGVFGFRLYLVMAFLMLFSVMWTVIDALSRMVSDIVHTNSRVGPLTKIFSVFSRASVHHLYYATVVLVVFFGALVLPLQQPLPWLVLSGVLGGFTMFIYTPILLFINNFRLPKEIRPSIFANLGLLACFVFYGFFSYRIILGYLD